MPDVRHDVPIFAPVARVWSGVATPAGLDHWWTESSHGTPAVGAEYLLDFGPGYQWKAVVTVCTLERALELKITEADADWTGTRVGFALAPIDGGTLVRFSHTGWPEENDHYRTSCYCWAMYLRILKRWIEHGEVVSYERRLEA